uniref:Uncharacterized protein n=1 Tax=Tanacetum cinerariifolium TaxID=118510 RepID=A0A6L2JV91_TANCI|nr:hypothetical protein [Tanacetum cinerariifolium]
MANENVPAHAPTRSNDQILPFAAWISVDIMQNTNFFRAFTASASVLAIYFQQFWDTLMFEAKTGAYHFQLDEDWFILDENLLRDALKILSLIKLVNLYHLLQSSSEKNLYKLSILFLLLRRIHSIHQRSGSPFNLAKNDLSLGNLKFVPKGEIDEVFGMQISKELITNNIRNAPYYNTYMEMVVKHNKKFTAEHGGKKYSASKADKLKKPVPSKQSKPAPATKPKVAQKNRQSLYLRSIQKGTHGQEPVGGVAIHEQVEDDIQQILVVEGKGKAIAADKQAAHSLLALHMPKRRSTMDQFIFQRQTRATEEASTGPSTQAQDDASTNIVRDTPSPADAKTGADTKISRKSPLKLIDEDEEAYGQAPVGGVAIREQVEEATQQLPMVEGKGKAIATDEQAAQSLLALHTSKMRSTMDPFIFQRQTRVTEEASTGPSTQLQDDASANIVHDTPSSADAETGADTDITTSTANTKVLYAEDVLGEEISYTMVLKEKIAELNEDQVGSDPGETPESRPPPEHKHRDKDQAGPNPGQSHEAPLGPNPEPMNADFIAAMYPKLHESLKHTTEEHVYLGNPLSLSGTLSSMKNLDDAFSFDDQFLNDKPTKEEPKKTTMETEAESMVIIPIHQASTSTPPLSTPIIDLSPLKLDQTTQALSSRIFTLELKYLPYKIDQIINEVVKKAVHVALQAPLRDRFRELLEADMKEILHQQMFESGSYKSLLEHVALYEAPDTFMEHANRDEFLVEKDKSRKRRCDDKDLPPPPPNSDPSKKKRHDSDASASKQPPAPYKDLEYLVTGSKERISDASISILKAAYYLDFGLKNSYRHYELKSDQAEEGPNYALMAFSSSSSNSGKSKLMVLGYKTSLESVEERLEFYKTNESIYLEDIKGLQVEIQIGEIAIRELRKELEMAQKEKDGIQLNVDKFEHASKNLNKLIECQIVENCKKGLGYENYNIVPPPYIGNFMPPTSDLYFTGLDEFVNKPVVENYKAKSSEENPKVVRKMKKPQLLKNGC